jgi:hypothetical protein
MFKQWLYEFEDRNFNYYKRVVLGGLGLDDNAVETQINILPDLTKKLQGLGAFRQLPDDVQQAVIGRIESNTGGQTFGDLIRMMMSTPHTLRSGI